MHHGFEACFYSWGKAVTQCTWLAFLISLLAFLYAGKFPLLAPITNALLS